MDVTSLLQALTIGEDGDWEFKSARGGIPGSLWETYSAMANTDGGTIALGVEDDGTVSGLPSVVGGAMAADSPRKDDDSPHKNGNSPHKNGDSPHTSPETDPTLLAIAEPARTKKRLLPEQTQEIVLQLCQGRYLTAQQIATLLNRYAERMQDRVISPMVRAELLEVRFPGEPNRPDQAYTAKAKGK